MKYIFLVFLFLAACASSNNSPTGNNFSSAEYAKTIERNSDQVRKYSGFFNTLDVHATLLNSSVSQAQLENTAHVYQWSDSKKLEEKQTVEARLSKETDVFMGFFTPERKNDDLYKTTTIWKIFLDVDGRRYEGVAKKIRPQFAELVNLYPYYSRFYTPYVVTFPVPLRSIDGKEVRMTITGVIASAEFTFPAN